MNGKKTNWDGQAQGVFQENNFETSHGMRSRLEDSSGFSSGAFRAQDTGLPTVSRRNPLDLSAFGLSW